MELEELKNRWEQLSRQLSRQQIVTRILLENTVTLRHERLSAYSGITLAVGILAIPLLIVLYHWKGISPGSPIAITAFCGIGVSLVLEWRKLRLLTRTKTMTMPLTEQERTFTAYLRAQYQAALFAFVFIAGYVGWMLVRSYDLLAQAGRVELIVIILAVSLTLAYVFYKWEARTARHLRKTLEELHEFEAE